MVFVSPWIAQLNKRRPVKSLERNTKTDVVVVGAGIAGTTTAYYLLKDTDKKVLLLDAGKLACGATGHNAGQMLAAFEHSFSYLAKKYGVRAAASAQRSVLSAWDLIDHIAIETKMKQQVLSFAGFYGIASKEHLLHVLADMHLSHNQHVHKDYVYLVDDPKIIKDIPKKYNNLYSVVDKENIKDKLKTKSDAFIAARTQRYGVMNSAKFCEELVLFMQKKYASRFRLYENSPVDVVDMRTPQIRCHANGKKIECTDVVICTNGFVAPTVLSKKAASVQKYLHVKGIVGYMCAYVGKKNKDATALAYDTLDFSASDDPAEAEPYVYLTRRPFKTGHLVCIGGPEFRLHTGEHYDKKRKYLLKAKEHITQELQLTFKDAPKGKIKYNYEWEGLMGYTRNGLRTVGKDPKNAHLYYNLGCNGIGILSSVFGSKRISLLMQGKKLKPLIFDPR